MAADPDHDFSEIVKITYPQTMSIHTLRDALYANTGPVGFILVAVREINLDQHWAVVELRGEDAGDLDVFLYDVLHDYPGVDYVLRE